MSSPSMQMVPEVGRSRQPKSCSKEDLPEPDGPVMATNSPPQILRETPSRARIYCVGLFRYSITRFSATISGASSNVYSSLFAKATSLPVNNFYASYLHVAGGQTEGRVAMYVPLGVCGKAAALPDCQTGLLRQACSTGEKASANLPGGKSIKRSVRWLRRKLTAAWPVTRRSALTHTFANADHLSWLNSILV